MNTTNPHVPLLQDGAFQPLNQLLDNGPRTKVFILVRFHSFAVPSYCTGDQDRELHVQHCSVSSSS